MPAAARTVRGRRRQPGPQDRCRQAAQPELYVGTPRPLRESFWGLSAISDVHSSGDCTHPTPYECTWANTLIGLKVPFLILRGKCAHFMEAWHVRVYMQCFAKVLTRCFPYTFSCLPALSIVMLLKLHKSLAKQFLRWD